MRGLGNINDLGKLRDMADALNDPEGIEELLLEESDETGISPAMLFADTFTIMRADIAALAREQGINMEVQTMTPERAAQLLADLAHPKGGNAELIQAFNEEAERRDQLLREVLDEDAYEAFMAEKLASLHCEGVGERPSLPDE